MAEIGTFSFFFSTGRKCTVDEKRKKRCPEPLGQVFTQEDYLGKVEDLEIQPLPCPKPQCSLASAPCPRFGAAGLDDRGGAVRNSNWTGGPGAGLRGLGLWGSLQTQQVPRGPPAEAGARAQEAGNLGPEPSQPLHLLHPPTFRASLARSRPRGLRNPAELGSRWAGVNVGSGRQLSGWGRDPQTPGFRASSPVKARGRANKISLFNINKQKGRGRGEKMSKCF